MTFCATSLKRSHLEPPHRVTPSIALGTEDLEQGRSEVAYLLRRAHSKSLGDSLSELRVVFDPVADDANHFGQLDHHLAVLIRSHSQRGQRRDLLGGHVPQLLLYDPVEQTRGQASTACMKFICRQTFITRQKLDETQRQCGLTDDDYIILVKVIIIILIFLIFFSISCVISTAKSSHTAASDVTSLHQINDCNAQVLLTRTCLTTIKTKIIV